MEYGWSSMARLAGRGVKSKITGGDGELMKWVAVVNDI